MVRKEMENMNYLKVDLKMKKISKNFKKKGKKMKKYVFK